MSDRVNKHKPFLNGGKGSFEHANKNCDRGFGKRSCAVSGLGQASNALDLGRLGDCGISLVEGGNDLAAHAGVSCRVSSELVVRSFFCPFCFNEGFSWNPASRVGLGFEYCTCPLGVALAETQKKADSTGLCPVEFCLFWAGRGCFVFSPLPNN